MHVYVYVYYMYVFVILHIYIYIYIYVCVYVLRDRMCLTGLTGRDGVLPTRCETRSTGIGLTGRDREPPTRCESAALRRMRRAASAGPDGVVPLTLRAGKSEPTEQLLLDLTSCPLLGSTAVEPAHSGYKRVSWKIQLLLDLTRDCAYPVVELRGTAAAKAGRDKAS